MQALVISDLHIGDTAKPTEFRPSSNIWSTNHGFLLQFKNFIKDEQIKPDCLIIAGDITNGADPDEVAHASKVIEWVAKSIGVPKGSILAIPGNHDSHWKVCELDEPPRGFWSQFRFAAFTHQNHYLSDIMARGTPNIFSPPFFLAKKTHSGLLIGLNTTVADYPDNQPHHGGVNQHIIDELDQFLAKLPAERDKYRLCAIHHHPINYSEIDPNYVDFSSLANSQNFLRVLISHEFDFLVHGHKHVPFFSIYGSDGVRNIPILGAGSFSATLSEPIYQGRVVNQVHLIEFAGRDTRTALAYGRIRSWAHVTANGWTESRRKHHGISHVSGFGKYHNLKYIERLLQREIQKMIDRKGHLEGRHLFTLSKDLKYIPTDLLEDALKNVCLTQSWELVGEIDDLAQCTIIPR